MLMLVLVLDKCGSEWGRVEALDGLLLRVSVSIFAELFALLLLLRV